MTAKCVWAFQIPYLVTTTMYALNKHSYLTGFQRSKHVYYDGRYCTGANSSNEKNGYKKLMKRKALRKHSLHEKTAATVLLKL